MNRLRHRAGFTAAEMLVATAIAGVVVGSAALVCSAVARAHRTYANVTTVTLPNNALANFYAQTGTTVSTYIAPNFGSVARAESLREKFNGDVAQAVAVYCLARNSGSYNTIRPTTIPSPPAGTNLDTPDAFRAYLATIYSGATSTFVSYRNYPSSAPCFSIYLLGYSSNATTIPVLAVYDLDLVTAKDPNNSAVTVGNYVTLRRYVANTLTDYYDVIYPISGTGTDSWYPAIVSFERQSRKAINEGTSIDRFKVAREKPFYFIFWPDPSRDSLKLPSGNTTSLLNPGFSSSDPRKAYNHMAGRTSYMFTVPLFPSA